MALRSFFAFDSDALIVTSSSDTSLIGNNIINNSDTPNGTTFTYGGGTGTTVTLDDTSNLGRFNDNQEADHVITDGGGIVANGTEVEAESKIFLRELDGNGNPIGPRITITVFSKDGNTSDVWGFGTNDTLIPGRSYVKVGGNNNGTTPYAQFITCFGPGTPIEKANGPVPVEALHVGQRVRTLHDGQMQIRWIGHAEVAGHGAFAPVRFAPGAIGNTGELFVSQEHRMLIGGTVAGCLFGEPEVLVAAKFLCGLPGVALSSRDRIRYTHFMCDRHVIVRAAGVPSESFFLSEHSVDGLEDGPRRELRALFPSLSAGIEGFGPTAAIVLGAREAVALRAYL